MGQELECTMRYQRRTLEGKAYLETDFVLFRGPERLKVMYRDLTGVTAKSGVLKLDFPGGPAEFELGEAAEKWVQKILHPPSRADKLGVKAGLLYRLVGDFDAAFQEELNTHDTQPAGTKAKADLVFYAARKSADLAQVRKLAGGMKPDGALWVVYPKGVQDIREIEVLEAGRAGGLKDTKVASFSEKETALRFVVPLDKR
jgi:hypothetical protein